MGDFIWADQQSLIQEGPKGPRQPPPSTYISKRAWNISQARFTEHMPMDHRYKLPESKPMSNTCVCPNLLPIRTISG